VRNDAHSAREESSWCVEIRNNIADAVGSCGSAERCGCGQQVALPVNVLEGCGGAFD
jgi:hypothetical protein